MKIKAVSNQNQLKIGAIFSYLLVILNTVFGLVVSPYILSKLGSGDYGVYKTIGSFSSTLLVLDLGIGTTVMRYTAKYRAEKKNNEIGNFAAMGLIEASIMGAILFVISMGIYFSLGSIYGNTFSVAELALAKSMFLITVFNMIFTMIDNVLNGVVTGANQFAFTNVFKCLMLLIRILLIYIVLAVYPSATFLVTLTLLTTIINVMAHAIYIAKKLNIHIRLTRWDGGLFKESLEYTILMFIQTIAIQANGNIDNIVIGAVIGSVAVAVYSFGIQMFTMYETISTSFSGLMLPTISQKIADGASDTELQAVVTRVGRIQYAILGPALIGFLCVGKSFIHLWLGDGFKDVYFLSLIMMVPVTFTLIENVCLSILRAKNMMKFRTISLIVTALLNAAITIVGTMLFNYYAAAVGTALSIIIGSIVMMNIYYHKRIGFKVFKFYKDVLHRIWICTLIPGVIVFVLNCLLTDSWITLLVRIFVYCSIYAVLMIRFGLNAGEKQMLFGKMKRRRQ